MSDDVEEFSPEQKVLFAYPHYKSVVVEVLYKADEKFEHCYIVRFPDDYDHGNARHDPLKGDVEVHACWLQSIWAQNIL